MTGMVLEYYTPIKGPRPKTKPPEYRVAWVPPTRQANSPAKEQFYFVAIDARDPYELPRYVADTEAEMAAVMHCTINAVNIAVSKSRRGKPSWCRRVKRI